MSSKKALGGSVSGSSSVVHRPRNLFSLNPKTFLKNVKQHFSLKKRVQSLPETLEIAIIGDSGTGKRFLSFLLWEPSRKSIIQLQQRNPNFEKLPNFGNRKKFYRIDGVKNVKVHLHCFNNREHTDNMEDFITGKKFFILTFNKHNEESFKNVLKWSELIDLCTKKTAQKVLMGISLKNIAKCKKCQYKGLFKSSFTNFGNPNFEISRKEGRRKMNMIHALHYFELDCIEKLNSTIYFLIDYALNAHTRDIFQKKMKRKRKRLTKGQTKLKSVLKDLDLGEYFATFEKAKVIWRDLRSLTDQEIKKLVPDLFPRKRLIRYLEEEAKRASVLAESMSEEDSFRFKDYEKKLRTKIRSFHQYRWYIPSERVVKGEIVGKGSYGYVCVGYLKRVSGGFKSTVSEKVAIKVIPTSSETELNNVLHEIEIMSKLGKHESILRCHGAFLNDRGVNIVLEYCASTLSAVKFNTLEEKLQVLVCIAQGIKHLHDRDIVHRDLKPENILIRDTESSGDIQVRISDFGTSKNVNSISNTFVGSCGFLAPEMYDLKLLTAEEKKAHAKKPDIYSFGVISWGVITGLRPFASLDEKLGDHSSFQKLIQIHKNKMSLDLKKISDTELRKVVGLMLIRDPRKRPSIEKVIPTLKKLYFKYDTVSKVQTHQCKLCKFGCTHNK